MNILQTFGDAKKWTENKASTSKVAREILRSAVYFCFFMVTGVVIAGLVFIYLGKIDVATGSLLGGMLTFFGGLLAIILPAFVNSLSNSEQAATLPITVVKDDKA